MRRMLISAFTLVLLSGATPLLASGSSGGLGATSSSKPMLVTQTLQCEVVQVTQEGRVKVRDANSGDETWIHVTEATKIKTKLKQAFDGRKSLEADDIAVGQTIKVTHRPNTGEVLKIKVVETA